MAPKKTLTSFILACSIVGTCLPSLSIAGEHDGVWVTPDDNQRYFMIQENVGTLLVVDLNVEQWEAFFGMITDNTATISELISTTDLEATIQFTSPTTATVTIIHCSPVAFCDFMTGDVFSVYKIY